MKTFVFPIKNKEIKKKLGFPVKQTVYSFIQLRDVPRVEFILNTRNYMNMCVMGVHLLIFYFMTSGKVLLVRSNDHIHVGTWSSIDNNNMVMEAEFEYMDSVFDLSIHKNVVTVKERSSHSFYLINRHYANKNHYRGVLMIPTSSSE